MDVKSWRWWKGLLRCQRKISLGIVWEECCYYYGTTMVTSAWKQMYWVNSGWLLLTTGHYLVFVVCDLQQDKVCTPYETHMITQSDRRQLLLNRVLNPNTNFGCLDKLQLMSPISDFENPVCLTLNSFHYLWYRMEFSLVNAGTPYIRLRWIYMVIPLPLI